MTFIINQFTNNQMIWPNINQLTAMSNTELWLVQEAMLYWKSLLYTFTECQVYFKSSTYKTSSYCIETIYGPFVCLFKKEKPIKVNRSLCIIVTIDQLSVNNPAFLYNDTSMYRQRNIIYLWVDIQKGRKGSKLFLPHLKNSQTLWYKQGMHPSHSMNRLRKQWEIAPVGINDRNEKENR